MTTVIRQDDLIESVADALQYISYYHPPDFIQAMNAAYEREINPAAKDAMAQAIKSAKVLGFPELDMEAIYEFQVKDMPVTVAVDVNGKSVHQSGPGIWRLRIEEGAD